MNGLEKSTVESIRESYKNSKDWALHAYKVYRMCVEKCPVLYRLDKYEIILQEE